MKKAIIYIIAAIYFAALVSAIGITPGSKTIFFEPGTQKELRVTIIKGQGERFNGLIQQSGEMAKYITIKEKAISMNEDETMKTVYYTLNMPDELAPGTHTAEIVISESSAMQAGEATISTSVAYSQQVNVISPFAGKYVESELDISTIQKSVNFFIRALSTGSEHIEKAHAEIYIYDKYNSLVSHLTTPDYAIEPGARQEFKAQWQAQLFGNYLVDAVLKYDNKSLSIKKGFAVGNFFIIPKDIKADSFSSDRVSRLDLTVQNLAYEAVNGFTAELILNSSARAESNPETIEGNSMQNVAMFLQKDNLREGVFKGKLVLRYPDFFSEHDVVATITRDSIYIEIVGITQQKAPKKAAEMPSYPYYAIMAVALGMAALFIIYFMKQRQSDNTKPKCSNTKNRRKKRKV